MARSRWPRLALALLATAGLWRPATAGAAPAERKADGAPAERKADGAPAERKADGKEKRKPRRMGGAARSEPDTPDKRKFMVGLMGTVMQSPPLRPTVVEIDRRFVGRSVAMGGLGVFGRYRLRPILGFDVNVFSGSVRYGGRGAEDQVSQDQIVADLGILLYLGRGKIAQFALSGGLGGMGTRVRYELEGDRNGSQTFGSGVVRIGAEAEFLVKRVAFVLAFRSYGIFTDRDIVTNRGGIFDGASAEEKRSPVPTLQTQLVGTAGIAFRF